VVKEVKEWKEPEWKAPIEIKEWKAPEWKAPVEIKEWKAPVIVEEWKPAEWKAPVEEWKEPEKPANYNFEYSVHDEHTGDIKSQHESAHHGAVKGQYSLIDSDGYKRIVDYTADDVHGFQATVKREPTHFKVPIPAPKIEKIITHAPIIVPAHEHWW
jgi:hypothetical protein